MCTLSINTGADYTKPWAKCETRSITRRTEVYLKIAFLRIKHLTCLGGTMDVVTYAGLLSYIHKALGTSTLLKNFKHASTRCHISFLDI